MHASFFLTFSCILQKVTTSSYFNFLENLPLLHRSLPAASIPRENISEQMFKDSTIMPSPTIQIKSSNTQFHLEKLPNIFFTNAATTLNLNDKETERHENAANKSIYGNGFENKLPALPSYTTLADTLQQRSLLKTGTLYSYHEMLPESAATYFHTIV